MKEFHHQPVMLREVMEVLQPKPGGVFADGTLGAGGHAWAVLAASAPDGRLYGCDRDEEALAAARQRLAEFAGRCELKVGNLAEMSQWVPEGICDGVLFDLGVSSPQLDEAERGFSFMQDGPLDMRMDRRLALTAADLVNGADAEELARIFRDYGDQPGALGIARAIERARRNRPFTTTGQLAELVARLRPREGRKSHPATRIFLALRIAVNDELNSLRRGLEGALRLLKPGGRLAVITFHSAEDRVVKEFGREGARDYEAAGAVDVPELRRARAPRLRWAGRKPRLPGAEEIQQNPRSRSAQLRVMEKL